MSAAWQVGPSYSPFNHTSNSQYGAWSGTNGYSGAGKSTGSTARKIGGAYVPTPPAARISEVTAKDVAKIVSAADPVTGSTKEKFSDFMSKYGSGKITPVTSQYDRVMAMHEKATPKRRVSYTPGNSPEPETLTELRAYNTAHRIPGNYNSSQRYVSVPSRAKDITEIDVKDIGFHRSHTMLDSDLSSMSKYSTSAEMTSSMKRTDTNNNMLHSSGYQSELTRSPARPALNRSSTFSGMPSQTEGHGLASRYADTRVGLDNLFNEHKRDLLKGPDSRYLSTSIRTSGSGDAHSSDYSSDGSTLSSPREYDYVSNLRSQNHDSGLHESIGRDNTGARDQGRDYTALGEYARENAIRSRDVTGSDSRGSMYWLYGSQGRPGPELGSSVNTKLLGQYRPGDYVMRLDSDYTPSKRYSSSLLDEGTVNELPHSESTRNDIGSQYGSYLERSRYGSTRPSTPYTGYDDDASVIDDAMESGYGSMNQRIPDVISKPSTAHRSILKKGSGNIYGTSTYADVPQYRGGGMGLQATKQLPPLSSLVPNRSTSGKKVTFNLAKNRFRAILD